MEKPLISPQIALLPHWQIKFTRFCNIACSLTLISQSDPLSISFTVLQFEFKADGSLSEIFMRSAYLRHLQRT